MIDVARFISRETGFDIPAFDSSLGTSEIKQLIDYLRGNKEAQQKIKEYVIKDPVVVSQMPDGSYSIADGNHRANLLNLIGVDVIPTIELNGRTNEEAIEEHKKEVEAILGGKQKEEALRNVESTTKALKEVNLANSNIPLPQLEINGYKRKASENYKLNDAASIAEAYHIAKADGSNPELVKAVESLLSKEQAAAEGQTETSAEEVERTYNKYLGAKAIEDITLDDYRAARAIGDKNKLEVTAKAFDALLQVENAETSVSPSAKKNAEKKMKEADEKALKEAARIMEHIDEIRSKLQENGVIEAIHCKWGK